LRSKSFPGKQEYVKPEKNFFDNTNKQKNDNAEKQELGK